MSEADTLTDNSIQRKQIHISPRELVFKYLRYLPWVIVSVFLMLLFAYIKLRYSTPVYKVSGKILVKKNSSPYSNNNEKFDDIFMMQGNSNSLNDEIEVIRSRSMAARVVKALGLQKQYYNKGNIRTTTIHPDDMPFLLDVQDIKDTTLGFSLLVTIVGDNQFKINDANTVYNFGQWIEKSGYKFRLQGTGLSLKSFSSNIFIISMGAVEDIAAGLSRSIIVAQNSDFNSNVILISIETENIKLGENIVNRYMTEYKSSGLEDKREIAVKTLDFIELQLSAAKQDLGEVEKNLQNFQETNKIISPEQQSRLFVDQITESNKQSLEFGLKLKVAEYLSEYLSDKKNTYKIVPSALGIEEPSLISQISEFDKLQLERETSLKSTPVGNPLIQNMESGLEKLRRDMLENLSHISATYKMALTEINKKGADADLQIQKLPLKQKQLLEKTREQKILEELYSYLLQKKLETSIASVSTISNTKVLEPARGLGSPVSPNRQGVYTFFLIIGLAIPVGVVFILEILNDRVSSRGDIEKVTSVPVLGEVGHAEEPGTLVVKQNTRQYIAEQFRIIRTNIKYIIPKVEKPVMMVTSSFSGEGKSFISTNLGAVMAVLGKKTVILEFDIRKPKIMEGLGLKERRGITNFIVGNIDLKEITYQVPGQENLFVIPCGPLPPNPAEMLLDEKVKVLFDQLKANFDFIIVDTAPVGLVSDAITLGQYVNASVYIVRHNYTLKKQLQLVDSLYAQSKLPHLSIIINDVSISSGGYYGYAYQNKYGYQYGYGKTHQSGYFDTQKKNNKGVFNKIKRWFAK